MNFAAIERDASARLTTLNAQAAAIAKRTRPLETSIRALGDHATVSLLKEELATLKSEALALAKRINALKGLIAAAKACAALETA